MDKIVIDDSYSFSVKNLNFEEISEPQNLISTKDLLINFKDYFTYDGILPQNCRYYGKDYNLLENIVLEYPPMIRTISVSPDLLLREYQQLKNSNLIGEIDISNRFYDYGSLKSNDPARVSISFPWLILYISMQNKIFYDMRVFFRLNPLTSLDDSLLNSCLPNIYDDYNNICIGRIENNMKIESIIDSFFFNVFNLDVTETFFKFTKKSNILGFMSWEHFTKKDPGFIFKVDWPVNNYSLRKMIELSNIQKGFDERSLKRFLAPSNFFTDVKSKNKEKINHFDHYTEYGFIELNDLFEIDQKIYKVFEIEKDNNAIIYLKDNDVENNNSDIIKVILNSKSDELEFLNKKLNIIKEITINDELFKIGDTVSFKKENSKYESGVIENIKIISSDLLFININGSRVFLNIKKAENFKHLILEDTLKIESLTLEKEKEYTLKFKTNANYSKYFIDFPELLIKFKFLGFDPNGEYMVCMMDSPSKSLNISLFDFKKLFDLNNLNDEISEFNPPNNFCLLYDKLVDLEVDNKKIFIEKEGFKKYIDVSNTFVKAYELRHQTSYDYFLKEICTLDLNRTVGRLVSSFSEDRSSIFIFNLTGDHFDFKTEEYFMLSNVDKVEFGKVRSIQSLSEQINILYYCSGNEQFNSIPIFYNYHLGNNKYFFNLAIDKIIKIKTKSDKSDLVSGTEIKKDGITIDKIIGFYDEKPTDNEIFITKNKELYYINDNLFKNFEFILPENEYMIENDFSEINKPNYRAVNMFPQNNLDIGDIIIKDNNYNKYIILTKKSSLKYGLSFKRDSMPAFGVIYLYENYVRLKNFKPKIQNRKKGSNKKVNIKFTFNGNIVEIKENSDIKINKKYLDYKKC